MTTDRRVTREIFWKVILLTIREKTMGSKLIYDEETMTLFIRDAFTNGMWFSEFGKIQNELLKVHHADVKIDMGGVLFC